LSGIFGAIADVRLTAYWTHAKVIDNIARIPFCWIRDNHL